MEWLASCCSAADWESNTAAFAGRRVPCALENADWDRGIAFTVLSSLDFLVNICVKALFPSLCRVPAEVTESLACLDFAAHHKALGCSGSTWGCRGPCPVLPMPWCAWRSMRLGQVCEGGQGCRDVVVPQEPRFHCDTITGVLNTPFLPQSSVGQEVTLVLQGQN